MRKELSSVNGFSRMYITLIRRSNGSMLHLCEHFDAFDWRSIQEISERLLTELPDWEVLEITV